MIKRADVIEELNEQGHNVQHATLSKWIRVAEEETGRKQGQLLDVDTVELIIDAVNLMRDHVKRGDKITFREATVSLLRARRQPQPTAAPAPAPLPAEPVTLTLSVEDAQTLKEILQHTQAHANWQRSVISGLSAAQHELAALKAQVQVLSERPIPEAAEPLFDHMERTLLIAGARQATRLDWGFALEDSQEGPVFMPRRTRERPLAIPDPEPSWWRRTWDWVLDLFTVRQAS